MTKSLGGIRRWTPDADAYLREHWKTGRVAEIAAHLGRSKAAIWSRGDKLQLPHRKPRPRIFRIPTPGMLALAGRFYGPAYAAELHGVDVETVRDAMRAERASRI